MTNTDTLEGIINNRYPVEKAIITAGYNEYDVENDVRSAAYNERNKGHFFINHLILRDRTNYKNNLKFNYPLDGIPILTWTMMNAYKSDLKKVVVVGNQDSKEIFDAFVDFYNVNKDGERFMFELEDDDWNIGATWKKGRDRLKPDKDELTLILPGDIPLCYSINHVIKDKHIKDHEVIINLNTKERVGKHFPRNYHFRTRSKGRRYDFKESNWLVVNIHEDKLDPELINDLYGGRKAYLDEKEKSQERGQGYIFHKYFYSNKERWEKTKQTLGRRKLTILAMKWLGRRKDRIIKELEKEKSTFSQKMLKYALKITSIPLDFLNNIPPLFELYQIEWGLEMIFKMKAKVKVENRDPATIEDIDSLEDWCYMNAMIKRAKKPEEIYPWYYELQRFKQVMPDLEKRVEFLRDFPRFINEQFETYGLVNGAYYPDGSPFLKAPPYDKDGNLNIQFTKKRVKKMVKGMRKDHRKYTRKVWKKDLKKAIKN